MPDSRIFRIGISLTVAAVGNGVGDSYSYSYHHSLFGKDSIQWGVILQIIKIPGRHIESNKEFREGKRGKPLGKSF